MHGSGQGASLWVKFHPRSICSVTTSKTRDQSTTIVGAEWAWWWTRRGRWGWSSWRQGCFSLAAFSSWCLRQCLPLSQVVAMIVVQSQRCVCVQRSTKLQTTFSWTGGHVECSLRPAHSQRCGLVENCGPVLLWKQVLDHRAHNLIEIRQLTHFKQERYTTCRGSVYNWQRCGCSPGGWRKKDSC